MEAVGKTLAKANEMLDLDPGPKMEELGALLARARETGSGDNG